MEETVMDLLNKNWFNLIQNPIEKEMDLLVVSEGIEVKFDVSAYKYWNFYIEFECNGKPSWLFREEAVKLAFWAHTDWVNLYLLEGDKLKRIVKEKIELCRANSSNTSKWFRVVENWWDWWRSKGLLYPIKEIEKEAKFIYKL